MKLPKLSASSKNVQFLQNIEVLVQMSSSSLYQHKGELGLNPKAWKDRLFLALFVFAVVWLVGSVETT